MPERLDITGLYLQNRHSHPDSLQATELAKKIQAGQEAEKLLKAHPGGRKREKLQSVIRSGSQAFKQLVEGNQGLVVNIAEYYARQTQRLTLLDHIQNGNVGLTIAAGKFNPSLGEFSTWATPWIKQRILAGIAEQEHSLRLPIHMQTRINQLEEVKNNLRQTLATANPSVEELAAAARQKKSRVRTTLRADNIARAASLDAPIKNADHEDDTSLGEIIPAPVNVEEEVIKRLTAQEVREALDRAPLDPRSRDILACRYELDDQEKETYAEIGAHYGLTGERIRQLEKKGLARIRAVIKDPSLEIIPSLAQSLRIVERAVPSKKTGPGEIGLQP